jgi:hypothetical protein
LAKAADSACIVAIPQFDYLFKDYLEILTEKGKQLIYFADIR